MHLDASTRSLFDGLDRLANAVTCAAPNIDSAESMLPFAGKFLDRGKVCCGNVGNVYIVTDSGAVRGGVVVSVEFKRRAGARGADKAR